MAKKPEIIIWAEKHWVGILAGAIIAVIFFQKFDEPILMSVQNMAIIPDLEVAGSAAYGFIEGIFGIIGGAAGAFLQGIYK